MTGSTVRIRPGLIYKRINMSQPKPLRGQAQYIVALDDYSFMDEEAESMNLTSYGFIYVRRPGAQSSPNPVEREK